MFPGNGRRQQHSHSPNGSETNGNQVLQNAWPRRTMGPPQMNKPPQPVEIEPGSYPRISGSYVPWESTAYSYVGETNPSLSNSLGHNKSGPVSLDFGARNSPPDPLTAWYTGNDGPWIAKGSVPEVSHDERIHPRGYTQYRTPGYGSPPGTRYRPGNPSDNESIHFGISPSDSGYGTGLESASVRGSDIVDHSQDHRSFLKRVPEMQQYQERGPLRKPHGTEPWPYSSPSANSYCCPTCHKQVKTKSELKKHDLRHTKPFRCEIATCTRKDGFSTVNDLNRHKQSKHPGYLSGEIHMKTYHCLVPGCKSQEKIWPRLDNFRSHLKRIHRLLENAMDQFVHRGEMDQRANGSLPSQGSSSSSPGRLDQDIQLGLVSEDFPELSYPDDHQEWSHVSSVPLNRQAEITERLMENTNPQILGPPNDDSPICLDDDLDDALEKPLSLRGSRASWDSDAGDGCLEKRKDLPTTDAASKSIEPPTTAPLGSVVDTLECTDISERCKTSKSKKATSIDPCLWSALTAVFSNSNPGKIGGSDQVVKSLTGIGSPGTVHVSEISPGRTDSRIALPSQAVTSGSHPDDQDPCLKASSAPATDKSDLTDQDAQVQKLLQAIKDVGYVLKKENKSQIGLGQNVNNLASGTHKRRDPVPCSLCTFNGRPCELKKHMKRHTRPYGCTFPKCQKYFGSKNDWKRHETSQHYQSEAWRCEEKINGATCTKVYSSADFARAHLTKMHKVTDPEAVERKIEARRIGANYQARFWCGFCLEIIDLTEMGVDAWTERFNHIDEHFMGKGGRAKQSIMEWKAADSEAEGAQQNVSTQPLSPNEVEETSGDSSPTSGSTSSASPDNTILGPSPDTASSQLKRKRADSDERSGRSKQPRHGKTELRVECCQCGLNLNPRFDTACPTDGHDICDRCQRRTTYAE